MEPLFFKKSTLFTQQPKWYCLDYLVGLDIKGPRCRSRRWNYLCGCVGWSFSEGCLVSFGSRNPPKHHFREYLEPYLGFQRALDKSLEVIKSLSIPVEISNRETLIECVNTSLSSKVVSTNTELLSPMAVDAVLKIIDPLTATNVDLKDIRIVKKLGGTIDDTELVEGIVFDKCKPSTASGGPTKI